MKKNGKLKIARESATQTRTLYLFSGDEISVNGETIYNNHAIKLEGGKEMDIAAHSDVSAVSAGLQLMSCRSVRTICYEYK